MLAVGDIVKLSKDKDGKFNHDYQKLEDATQYELLQLEKVALDLKNRLAISLEMRKQMEGDKTTEA